MAAHLQPPARSNKCRRILNVMMHVQLPDRKWITLCEAVTAFVYGESRDASSVPFYPVASDALLEQLHDAAQAGAIKFRALRRGNNNYQEINPGYFSTTRHFDWKQNQIIAGFRAMVGNTSKSSL
jgi:hypothetical protein